MKLLSDTHLFWDTDVSLIDPERHKSAIIERVLERGSWSAVKELIQFYGKEEIVEVVKRAKWFSDKTMHFISGYFDIPLKEMRCYTEKQSSPIPYL